MELPPWVAFGIVAAATVGHFGLHVAAYNRINATGLRRPLVKGIVKFLLLSCLLLPLLAVAQLGDLLAIGWRGELTASHLATLPSGWQIYGTVCLLSLPLLGIPWLCWRPIWKLEWIAAPRQIEVADLQNQLAEPIALTRKCRIALQIPGNQIGELAVERIELPVAGLPPQLDGYRIAQLSDLHFTGHLSPAMTAWAVERGNAFEPHLFALTGDIVDKVRCIDWLSEALEHARAVDGCYFILGNHDRRVSDPAVVRSAMVALGWHDVGSRCVNVRLSPAAAGPPSPSNPAAGVAAQILGNERPWFAAPSDEQLAPSPTSFRLLLAHSPDQFGWAQRHGVQLMLAGHTHGGQGRLPLIGPVLSPSWHGSRFASGDFFKSPTTMHVSRGLSGAHLLRFRCRPELSLLTLRSQ
jgi:predicted MPP superfamily phosphohydrolase